MDDRLMNTQPIEISGLEKKFPPTPSWARFSAQAFKDFRSFVYMTALLSLFRLILIFLFISRKDASSGLLDILHVLGNGFRFDSRVAMYFVMPTFVLGIAGAFFSMDRLIHRVRLAVAACFTVLTLLLCSATIPYFREYDDQFNSWIFGLIYDDFGAIIGTAWNQVPVVRGLAAVMVLAGGLIWFLWKYVNREPGWANQAGRLPVWLKTILTVLILCLVIAGARGSAGPRPVQLKDVAITRDSFLNKTVLNPYEALRYHFADYKATRTKEGIKTFLPDGDIRTALKTYFNDSRDLDNIDDYMLRRASGPRSVVPKHIFVILMEGYDSWPMLDAYQSLRTCEQLKAIAAKGIWIKRFLPAFRGTPHALNTIIAGLPDIKTMTNYQASSRKPYPTSIAPIFKQLGYKTRFFYSGYLSWQRIEDFCRHQGFDEIYGAPHMGNWAHANEWGVDDETLFQFIEKTISEDEPSFSMIMTTSYHPPYDIDVYGLGYPVQQIPPDLAKIYDGSVDLRIFGHLWYSDKCLGAFVKQMEQRLSAPVFAITGDHWSRKFINSRPSLYERSSVPLVLYGPGVLDHIQVPEGTVGSHIDIGPTLVELAAPKGFTYHSMGRNLLKAEPQAAAFGAEFAVITKDAVFENQRLYVSKTEPGVASAGGGAPVPSENGRMFERAQDYYAIGWWRIMRGASLPLNLPAAER